MKSGLSHEYNRASRICQSLHSEDGLALNRVCRQIREAEKALNLAARPYLNRCMDICHGLCCRNVYLDEIIGMEDFLYILVLIPELAPRIEKRLKHVNCLFTADCIFLEGRKGPCIFPPDIRPEVCITSFCVETPNASRQIGTVKWRFQKLAWSARLLGMKMFFRRFGFIP